MTREKMAELASIYFPHMEAILRSNSVEGNRLYDTIFSLVLNPFTQAEMVAITHAAGVYLAPSSANQTNESELAGYEANEVLAKAIDRCIKAAVDADDYATPMQAAYSGEDILRSLLNAESTGLGHAVANRSQYLRVEHMAQKHMASKKARAKKKLDATLSPEILAMRRQLRQLVADENKWKKEQEKTDVFRLIGGIAKIGGPYFREISRLRRALGEHK